jgi:hypothetical protein
MTDELSDFTKLVLARLETNPDEFQMGGRWDTLVRGLEAYAAGEVEGRYARTLWPLTDHERSVMLDAYRKAYLARLHKDMLKNIVSGDDLPQNKAMDPRNKYSGQAIVGSMVGNAGVTNSVLTTSAMQQATLTTLEASFDKVYAKAEGQPVYDINSDTITFKAKNRYAINRSQMEVAKKLGISPEEYARLVNIDINGGPV